MLAFKKLKTKPFRFCYLCIMRKIIIAQSIIGLLLLTSCVPQRKLLESENRVSALNSKLSAIQVSIDSMQSEKQNLIGSNLTKEQNLETLRRDSIATHNALDMQIKAYENLSKVQQKIITNNESENAKMLMELNKRSEELKKKELDLANKEADFIEAQNKNKGLNMGLKDREQKITELENALKQKDSAVKALNTNITNALTGYNNIGLTVKEKDGKVYVSLEEKLLFKSGSYAIDEKGKKVLLTLAQALNENPDVTVMIEGHTDNVPLSGKGVIKDNWELSVLRATTIVKILVDEGNVNPKRVIASGRGEYLPLELGDSPDARQANRRTEIILTPKLSELLKALK